MDQQGRVAVPETSTGAGSATYFPGTPVYDADGEKLGAVSDRQDKDNFLLVHKGRLFGRDVYIPRAAIDRSNATGVHLRVRKDELTGANQKPLPEPTAPITDSTGAPVDVATDQPPTVPMAPPIPVPDMGEAAVAATAFSHDTAQAATSASGGPMQSTVETAGADGGHAVEAARQGVGQGIGQATDFVREQVGPLVDAMRARVGPIAEQVKDQASTVTQEQMTSAAEGLDSVAGAVNAVGDRLRENSLGELAQYSDLATEQIEKAAAWLRTTTPDEIAHDIEDYAKKQPAVFVAGALALGLIGVRFLRSASQDDSPDAGKKQ
jgi:hypothetical protein